MSTNEHEPDGIHAKRIEAENVVSGVQIQGGDAQTAFSLIQLAQAIQRGEISAEEIKARNLVSGLQYIADPAQANVEDLRRELLALRTQLEQAIASQEFSDPADAQDAQDSLATAEIELAKSQPNGNRVLRKLDELSQIITRSAETADAAGKLGALVIQLAPLAATLCKSHSISLEASMSEQHGEPDPALSASPSSESGNQESRSLPGGRIEAEEIKAANVQHIAEQHIHQASQKYLTPLHRPRRAEHFQDRVTERSWLLTHLHPGQIVTLCGPGGMGKTALVAEVLWTLAPADSPPALFPHGLVFHSF